MELINNEYYLYNDRRFCKTELFCYRDKIAHFQDGTIKQLTEEDIKNNVKDITENVDIYGYVDWKRIVKNIKVTQTSDGVTWVTYPYNDRIRVCK